MEEVDVLAVDLGRELGMGVDRGLGRPPVVLVPPRVVERSDVRLLDAVVDVAGELVGPARPVEPVAQVVEVGLGDVEREGSDRRVGSWDCSCLPKRNEVFRSIMTNRRYLVQMESGDRPLSGRRAQARRNDARIRDAAREVFTADPGRADVGRRGARGRGHQRALPALREQGGPAPPGGSRRAGRLPRGGRGRGRRRARRMDGLRRLHGPAARCADRRDHDEPRRHVHAERGAVRDVRRARPS